MNPLVKILFPLLLWASLTHAHELRRVEEYHLDEHTVHTIPVALNRVTTISFPGPITAIDAANVTNDPKTPGLFQIAHAKGSYFFTIKALVPKAATNVNIRWNRKTYVLELVESPTPLYSVLFQYVIEEPVRAVPVRVAPERLLALLDKAKAYPILKSYHPEAVAQVEYLTYSKESKSKIMDCGDYEIQIEEIFRFNPEDTLVLRLALRNKTDGVIHYAPDSFALRVGERTYPQALSDASGTIPPQGQAPVYFAITGTPDGGRNDLSLKNEFAVLLDRFPAATEVGEQEGDVQP